MCADTEHRSPHATCEGDDPHLRNLDVNLGRIRGRWRSGYGRPESGALPVERDAMKEMTATAS
jgi:hypothetical protein